MATRSGRFSNLLSSWYGARTGMMPCLGVRRAALTAVAGLALTMPISPALGQPDSPATMRQRIAELERTLASVRADLERVMTERDALIEETRRLREAVSRGVPGQGPINTPDASLPAKDTAGGGGGGDDVGRQIPISALSQDPLSSPDALFVSLLLSYRDAFVDDVASPAMPTEAAVEAWTKSARAEFEGPVTWLMQIYQIVRTEPADGKPARLSILVGVLDPATTRPLSRPVMIDIPKRFAGRFPASLGSGETMYAEMRLKIEAAPVFQPGRTDPGPFDYPPIIGPYAGFGYELEIVGIRFVDDEELKSIRAEPAPPVDR